MISVLKRAFENGCGMSFEQAVQSDRFEQLRQRYQVLATRYPASCDQGTALRVGHRKMVTLLNTLPEQEALAVAHNDTEEARDLTETQPLIDMLGETIVRTAESCLPAQARELAAEWQTATVDRQIGIAGELFRLFRSNGQGDLGSEMSREAVIEAIQRRIEEQHRHIRAISPAAYGPWDPDSPANCQGKSQMLTAFGRLAGTSVMCVSPLTQATYVLEEARRQFFDELCADFNARGFQVPDESFRESLRAFPMDNIRRLQTATHSFHVAVTLQLKDGSWVLIDPHGLSWGVFSEDWHIPEVTRLLEKYADVLPGLTLIGEDQGQTRHAVYERYGLAHEILERSRQMEERIQNEVQTPHDLVELLAHSEDLDLLFHHTAESNGTDDPTPFSENERYMLALNIVFGGNGSLPDPAEIMRASMDPEFLTAAINSWLTFYHATGFNVMNNQLTEAGRLLHPVCEFARPEQELAVSMLASFSQERGEDSSKVLRTLLDHNDNQLVLGNALVASDGMSQRAAAETLQQLPFLHPLNKKRMERRGR